MNKELMRHGRSLFRGLAAMGMALLVAACSPDYNWRTVTVGDGLATAFFPDRPTTQERTVAYEGHDIVFGMNAASVDKTLFTVAYAILPPALANDPASAEKFGQSVLASLYQNLGQAPPETLPAFGEPFEISGNPGGNLIRLQGVVWMVSGALVEAVVVADESSYPQAQAEQFFQGLQVGR
jgi:hypothetical protein